MHTDGPATGAMLPGQLKRLLRPSYALAVVVLLLGLAAVFYYAHSRHERELRAAQATFESYASEIAERMRQQVVYYDLILRGGVSLVASVDWPTAEQWTDYTRSLRIDEQFPSIVGLGFAPYLASGQLQDFQLQLRDRGEGLFVVHPAGVRREYGPVLYLMPATPGNRAAIGFDMYSEPRRQAAMRAAADAGETRMTAPVELVQDAGQPRAQPSALLYAPVYRSQLQPGSIAERRDSLRGWVYAPIRLQTLVEITTLTLQRPVRFRIRDITDGHGTLLYADPALRDGATHSPPAFTTTRDLEVYGRRWRLAFESQPLVEVEAGAADLRATVLVGLACALLLFGLVLALAMTEARADALASRMSESYRRSEQRFRNAMEYSAIGKALLDSHGDIVEANPALAGILGTTQEALVGQALGAQFADAEDPLRTGQMQSMQDGVHRTTRRLRRGDGEVRHAQLTFAPVPGDLGQDVVGLVQVEDVTERLRAEAQVRALNRTLEARVAVRTRELTQANEELESFAYSVSHDLRAPLRSIDGFSRLLRERYGEALDETGRVYLERVRSATTRMDELIDAILKVSRIGRSELKPCAIDLSQLAGEIVSELREQDPSRRVEVRIEPGLRAWADPALARNLLQNLLDNAWKFTAATTAPCIRLYRDAHAVVVEDNGAGFDSNYANKLFRPFQRLHAQQDFAGHGIGLASVRRILERHGGSIRAEGKPGEGARFLFVFPEPPAEESAG
ncbi:MAG: CHASE domain-containing protein [Thermomonas sp.]